ncbi:MAG: Small ribosomal subunit biogenesis GTPase RsgA [Chlamydiales bacterium]|nr:Small ribosomal subunit biogenesis GTPase RsgA [Chlamydiales bacterium]MCH9619546.1 Small ribosomal subunit biogenesis GTPase RsgA [Chlamydiales bacterium]MCH9623152.1 Small ribosomal subunit biogenesis GTPase RsgA [Chlamydiales bacterium]
MKKEELPEGRVLSVFPEEIIVDYKKEKIPCVIRGALKKTVTQTSTLIAVGDRVLFDLEKRTVESVIPRHSTLSRVRKEKEQIIAANVDQVLITTSISQPPLKPALIDRYIIATYKGKMEPIIVINKIDLLEETSYYKHVVKLYHTLGIPVIPISVETKKGLPTLKKAMKGKTSVFSGQSGVGKSSLINLLADLSLRTGEVRGKGIHTTTRTSLFPLPFGGYCIDTPGIRSFGVWDLRREDLIDYFPEITQLAQGCKYPNCTHTHEPSCAVKEGEIDPIRYQSFLKLQTEISRL